jgi:signal transduction histidine kinase
VNAGLTWASAAARELRGGLVERVLHKAKEAERSRDMLLGMVSHDLRNPLGVISMTAQLLGRREGETTDEASKVTRASARIGASSDRMRRMIEQLLDYTRSKAGTLTVTATEFDLAALCVHIAEETTVAHPGFRLDLELPPTCTFVGDVDRIAQVISNLLGNARHHGDPAAPTVLALRDAPDAVALEVRNSGKPIPPERLASIFEPFKRESNAATRHKGLGLGLFIVRSLVELHKGTVQITSTEAGETACVVRLPRIAWLP